MGPGTSTIREAIAAYANVYISERSK